MLLMFSIFLFLITGAVTGLLAGLLGVGGGVIVVPSLAYIFSYMHLPKNLIMTMAASTSLAAMMFTTFVAVITQHKRKMINWTIFRAFAPAIVIGTIMGACIASALPAQALKMLFGTFILFIAIHLLLQKKPLEDMNKPLPARIIQYSAGFLIGTLSGLLGIGGGALTVPILLQFGLSTHQATGTSSACAFLLSIVGTISFIILGWHIHSATTGVMGYVDWTAALAIAITSMAFVPLGTLLGMRLSSQRLKQVFAVFMLLMGMDMLVR